MYTFLKFLHIAAVAVWLGGVITMLTLNRAFASTGDPSLMRALGQQGGKLSMRMFGPASLTAVITGIGMVQIADYSFGAKWISWGFLGFILSMVLGGVLTGGTGKKIATMMAAGNADPARIAALQKRIVVFAVLNILLLLTVVYVMVAKPV